jgi:S-DNA-T family DNA segregation ATPase FtsK/SpoIIIE
LKIIPHWSWFVLFAQGCTAGVVWVYRWVRRHPKVFAALALLILLTAVFGFRTASALPFYVLPPVLGFWWLVARSSFRRWVAKPLRADWRRWWRYERRWVNVMALNRLSEVIDNGLDVYPQIWRVRCHQFGDTVIVKRLLSQTNEDYERVADALASDFGAEGCRVYRHPKGVRLEFAYGPDPLAETIPALPIPASSDDIDFRAVPVGATETGEPWTIDLALHILLAGQTGSGKSGVLQQLVRSLAPVIHDGRVIVWGIDPKEGMEFRDLKAMFARYEDGEIEDIAEMLADAVTMMRKQMRKLRVQGLRKHVPTKDMPLMLVVIDEMVDLTDPRGKPKDLWMSIHASLGHLLRKGRAAGVIVVGAVTDPRVEALPMRRAFPVKIGARLDTADETIMVLGKGAEDRGARCHEIPVELPGVCYVLKNTERDAVRVRAAFVEDEDIEAMVAEYAPKPKLAAVS